MAKTVSKNLTKDKKAIIILQRITFRHNNKIIDKDLQRGYNQNRQLFEQTFYKIRVRGEVWGILNLRKN
ncbi:MAG: hypothetical protein K0R54_2275 [Clostridiaceae bacterium]|jgi:hypothetical protein|nr:hypothetical protein [Clostridiaceae bacterium]